MTKHELVTFLSGDRSGILWSEIERIEKRYKGPLRKERDPAWFLVDDIFEDLRAIPRRLSEEKTVDAEKQEQ
jgi:hypothetical protein